MHGLPAATPLFLPSAAEAMADGGGSAVPEQLLLVARKARFGLPTACPSCLSAYFYLRFADAHFNLQIDRLYPDSDHVPYAELGDYVFFNNENGGVIEGLKKDRVIDLDAKLSSQHKSDWLSTKAMVSTWLADALNYELWVSSDGSLADEIYFSDLPWPIRKYLHWKQSRLIKNLLQIRQLDASEREKEIYQRASDAYEALSLMLGEQKFFFEDRPTSLDAIFLGHALFVYRSLPDNSELRNSLVKHDNLVKYAENLNKEYYEASSSSSSSIPKFPVDPSTSSTPRGRGSSRWSSKPKPKPKKEKTEEEKTFRRRGKYFLAAQLIAVLVFLTVMGGSKDGDFEVDDDEDDGGLNY